MKLFKWKACLNPDFVSLRTCKTWSGEFSGVVRPSAAWGENKKCRPCLYFLRLFEYDSGSFDRLFCLPKIWIWFKWNNKHYFTNHWQLIYFSQNHSPTRHCGLVVSAPSCDGSGCEFDSWQCRIYIPCSLTLRLLGSLRGSLGTYGLT